MKHYFKYSLVVIFLAAITVIVLLQFNSNKNIDQLIAGNESLLHSQQVKTQLQQLQKSIYGFDAEMRNFVMGGRKKGKRYLELSKHITAIQNSRGYLQVFRSDPVIAPLVTQLNERIEQKLLFNKTVLDTLRFKGKEAAEGMIRTLTGVQLTDSINTLILNIDQVHEQHATLLVDRADKNGKNAKTYGSMLAILAVLASLVTFSYISLKMEEQRRMIARLNLSEQQAKESVRAKEQFLANMSHEIRTPLNAILGFTGLLGKKQLDEEGRQYVGFIDTAGDNLLHIVNDILDLSKIEAGMMRIEPGPFNFQQVIYTLEGVYKEKAREKNIRLAAHIHPDVPGFLTGDAQRLNQALTNLVGNSLKFTNSGGIDIYCKTVQKTEGEVQLSIEVNDTGTGIPQDQLEKIFDRFHQSDEGRNRRFGGTGLGLTIARDLVHLMHGALSVESTEDAGSSFRLVLPFKIPTEAEVAAISKTVTKSPVLDRSKKILVVEDNELNQSLMEHLLASWGLTVKIVGSGMAALKILQTESFELILMDIQMPELDGYAAASSIRETLKITTPIIAMTAHALPGEKERCLAQGMNDYIPKPIDAQQLKSLLAGYIPLEPPHQPPAPPRGGEQDFKYIKTGYLRSISLGNKDYETTVTQQFIEVLPGQLDDMHRAWMGNDGQRIKEIAHNMKTTISIFELLPLVEGNLNELEQTVLTPSTFEKNEASLKIVARAAVEEAQVFLNQLNTFL